MKLRILITLFIIIGSSVNLLAQRRQLQEARSIIKSGKNYDQAEKMMTNLLKDSANRNNPRIYEMWLISVEKQYDQVNEEMYKKHVVDTTKFFSLTRRIFTIGERLDSLDMRPDKKGRVTPSYRSDNARRLVTYRPNLYFGGTYAPTPKVKLNATYHYMATAAKLKDAGKTLGHEVELGASYKMSDMATLSAGYTLMLGSDTMKRLKRTGDSQRLNWAWLMLQVSPEFLHFKF